MVNAMPITITIPTAEEIRDVHNSAESRDLDELLGSLEIASRQVEAAIVDVIHHGCRHSAWAYDGHRTATQWVTAVMGVSRSRALGRVRTIGFAALGLHRWADAVSNGTLGIEQAWALGRTAANPRVREHLQGGEVLLLDLATSLPYKDFIPALTYWESLADQDGALASHEASHSRRRLSMGFVGNEFHFKGSCGATQGAVIKQLLEQFIQAEFRADLKAVQDDDTEATEDQELPPEPALKTLPRTASQRSLDALVTALQHAASSDTNTVEPVVNLLCDATTLIEWLRFGLGGAHPLPDPNADTLRRCESMGGGPVDPRLMLDAALSGRIRSIIIGGDNTPHSVTSTSRFFNHHVRDAIRSLDLTCFWPGCEVPASYCEIDHLRPHVHGGATAPANAGPACRRHNGWKGDRWYAGRKRWGWAITRPDGSTFSGAPPSPPTP
jgi:hypothetical protein